MENLVPVKANPSMSDYVADTLRDAITSLQLAPGSPIVEATVARQLGVSTTPVREAFHRLAKDGLVVLSRYRGANVVKMSVRDVNEIYQLRQVLEPLTVKLAVPNFTADDVAAMGALLERAGRAIVDRELAELSRCNREFHGMFMVRSDNDRLRSILENLQDQNRIIALLAWRNRGFQPLEHEEHSAIFDAVKAGDAERAAAAAHHHITRFAQATVAAWAEVEAANPSPVDTADRG
jgi:DNA-binding GntR family transcriptional regulator